MEGSLIEQADRTSLGRPSGGWRLALYRVIFESDTRAGRVFDIALIWLILISVGVAMADSVASYHLRWGPQFDAVEWTFTVLFSIEYLARLSCVQRPSRYATSLLGVIDILAVLPTWAALFVPGLQSLIDVRMLRLLRLFRILKLAKYVEEFGVMGQALMASRRKIMVFLSFVLAVVIVMGSVMYVVEGPANGFTNIPVSIYWAVSTMTTVGFGDIAPKTGLGRFIASVMMLIGWGTLAVPTGIVSSELSALHSARRPTAAIRVCKKCCATGHDEDAGFCNKCGASLTA